MAFYNVICPMCRGNIPLPHANLRLFGVRCGTCFCLIPVTALRPQITSATPLYGLGSGGHVSNPLPYNQPGRAPSSWGYIGDYAAQGLGASPTCVLEATQADGAKIQSTDEPRSHQASIAEDLEKELEAIVGLEDLKEHLRRWCKGFVLDQHRRKHGYKVDAKLAPPMVFLGNPGTGKTKVARLLAGLLHKLGALKKNIVVEVQRTDLVGEYVGWTGPKTRAKLEEAEGGVLFVDEAYRLVPATNRVDFGEEALEEIMSQMDTGKVMCIFAGYLEPMKRVLDCNEGFRRRAGKQFAFNDFTSAEIAKIMQIKVREQDTENLGFYLSKKCTLEAIASLIEKEVPKSLRSRLNGGLAQSLLEEARDQLNDGLMRQGIWDGDALMCLTMGDLEAGILNLKGSRSLA